MLCTSTSSRPALPFPPQVFFGRTQEVDAVLDTLLHQSPARIAILGPGGIGKTAIALTALHSPDIESYYQSRRYFVACDGAASTGLLVQEIASVLGLPSPDTEQELSTDLVLSFLGASRTLLCLDNFETPWDADAAAVESFLAQITALATVSVVITTRGARRPPQTRWTTPLLAPIGPLPPSAALATWTAICGDERAAHHDGARLVAAVDRVPLAVTLLAHAAQAVPAELLWRQWTARRTAMVCAPGPCPHTRLSSLETSIALSLHGPRIVPAVLDVLSVLCMLPLGMALVRVHDVERAFKGALDSLTVSDALAVLLQCSLAHQADGAICVLAPVRHYVRQHHFPRPELLARLLEYYAAFVPVLAREMQWRGVPAATAAGVEHEEDAATQPTDVFMERCQLAKRAKMLTREQGSLAMAT